MFLAKSLNTRKVTGTKISKNKAVPARFLKWDDETNSADFNLILIETLYAGRLSEDNIFRRVRIADV